MATSMTEKALLWVATPTEGREEPLFGDRFTYTGRESQGPPRRRTPPTSARGFFRAAKGSLFTPLRD